MEWISTTDRLPEDGQRVLGYYEGGNWIDNDSSEGSQNIIVVEFIRGITNEERALLLDTDDRKKTWQGGDEGFNNQLPYYWDQWGPGSQFGQDIKWWSPLPGIPPRK